MKRSEVENIIRKMVSEITNIPAEDLEPAASFMDEYNLDSLRALEILAAVENQFGIIIDPDLLAEMNSIEKVVNIAISTMENMGKA